MPHLYGGTCPSCSTEIGPLSECYWAYQLEWESYRDHSETNALGMLREMEGFAFASPAMLAELVAWCGRAREDLGAQLDRVCQERGGREGRWVEVAHPGEHLHLMSLGCWDREQAAAEGRLRTHHLLACSGCGATDYLVSPFPAPDTLSADYEPDKLPPCRCGGSLASVFAQSAEAPKPWMSCPGCKGRVEISCLGVS